MYNGVAQNAGWLGENSTEITGIADVMPNDTIEGVTHTIVSNQPPHPGGFPVATNLQWYTGENFQFESYVVNMGRLQYPDMPANYMITWESSNEAVATISADGLLTPVAKGDVVITSIWEDPDDTLSGVKLDSVIVDSIVGRGGTSYIWETFYTGIFREFNINIEVGGVDAIVANNTIENVVGKPGDSFTYDLEGLFTDPNDPDATFIYMIFGGHDMTIADAEIVDGKITFELKSVGDIGIIIKCQTNGKMGQTTIPVSVRDDEPTSIVTNSSSDKEYPIYPNPASNFINIKNAERVNIEVFNISGIRVGELNNYSYGQSIYVGHLNSGIYLITINSGTDIKTLKFQKK